MVVPSATLKLPVYPCEKESVAIRHRSITILTIISFFIHSLFGFRIRLFYQFGISVRPHFMPVTPSGRYLHNTLLVRPVFATLGVLMLLPPLIYFAFENLTTLPAELTLLGSHSARLSIVEGRYHQVKRMFGFFDNKVTRLHRERMGPLQLDPALAPGQYRALRPDETAPI